MSAKCHYRTAHEQQSGAYGLEPSKCLGNTGKEKGGSQQRPVLSRNCPAARLNHILSQPNAPSRAMSARTGASTTCLAPAIMRKLSSTRQRASAISARRRRRGPADGASPENEIAFLSSQHSAFDWLARFSTVRVPQAHHHMTATVRISVDAISSANSTRSSFIHAGR
jgi:hypothetical protein